MNEVSELSKREKWRFLSLLLSFLCLQLYIYWFYKFLFYEKQLERAKDCSCMQVQLQGKLKEPTYFSQVLHSGFPKELAHIMPNLNNVNILFLKYDRYFCHVKIIYKVCCDLMERTSKQRFQTIIYINFIFEFLIKFQLENNHR